MITPRTIQELASAMFGRLELAIRFTGSELIVLKHGSPNWMYETAETVFNTVYGGSSDDWSWRFLAESLAVISESADPADPADATMYVRETFRDRAEWLASAPSRAKWCDEYTEEAMPQIGGGMSLAEILREGMEREKNTILDALRTRLDWLSENYGFGDSWIAIDSRPMVSGETKP
jgi:hypothetical protein